MKKLISVQLYSVREALGQDYEGTIRKIAAMGYDAVEPAGFPEGVTAESAKKLFDELGLQVPSMHAPLPVGENKDWVLEQAKTLGAKYLFSGIGPDKWGTVDDIKAVAAQFNEAAANAAEFGIKVGNHNHDWEMKEVDGKLAYRIFLENVSSDVLCQIDTCWVKIGGLDPVAVVKEIGSRAPVLHIKDGPCVRGEDFMAVGAGKMDFPPIIEAAEDTAEMFVVELDSCATDMLEAVEQSYNYLSSIVK